MTNLEIGEVVLCTVDRIVGTNVFVKIEGDGEGTIVLSEIAPGRIRNLREYVVPKKQIICKVLRIQGDRIELSLRRVTPKEQKELKEKYNLVRSYKSILKSILKEKTEEVIKKIELENSLYEFIEESKENTERLNSLLGKENTEKFLEIIKSQKQKIISVKKEIIFKTKEPNGLEIIKKLLGDQKEIEVKYISAGRYFLVKESDNLKKADNFLKEIIEELEKEAKKNKVEFSIKEK